MHGITLSEGFKQERNSIILFLKKLILRRSTRENMSRGHRGGMEGC